VIGSLLGFRSEKGAAVVKFAVLPLLLFMVIVATVESPGAWTHPGVMNGAARGGARYAAIVPDVEDNLDAATVKVKEVLNVSRIPDEDIQVEVAFGGSSSIGTPITANVIVTFLTSFGNLFPKLNELPLRAACSMRTEV
jgi:Flp pilus assembly protein TadG